MWVWRVEPVRNETGLLVFADATVLEGAQGAVAAGEAVEVAVIVAVEHVPVTVVVTGIAQVNCVQAGRGVVVDTFAGVVGDDASSGEKSHTESGGE
jgi:hypothetical protein